MGSLPPSGELASWCTSLYHDTCFETFTWPAPTVIDGARFAAAWRLPRNIIVPPANAVASPMVPSRLVHRVGFAEFRELAVLVVDESEQPDRHPSDEQRRPSPHERLST